jgi:hypothetical protein
MQDTGAQLRLRPQHVDPVGPDRQRGKRPARTIKRRAQPDRRSAGLVTAEQALLLFEELCVGQGSIGTELSEFA